MTDDRLDAMVADVIAALENASNAEVAAVLATVFGITLAGETDRVRSKLCGMFLTSANAIAAGDRAGVAKATREAANCGDRT